MTIPNETCPVCGGEVNIARYRNGLSGEIVSIDHSKELAEAIARLIEYPYMLNSDDVEFANKALATYNKSRGK